MLKLVGEISIDMSRTWIETTELLEHGLYFVAQHPILIIETTAHFDIVSHSVSFAANGITTVLQTFDVFDGCEDEVSEWNIEHVFGTHTFCKNLPLARLSTRRIWQYVVEFIKQRLHLTTTFTLGHLVADTKFGRAAIIARATRCLRRARIMGLQTGDGPMLE